MTILPLSDVFPTVNFDKLRLECIDTGIISISEDPVAIKTDMVPCPSLA